MLWCTVQRERGEGPIRGRGREVELPCVSFQKSRPCNSLIFQFRELQQMLLPGSGRTRSSKLFMLHCSYKNEAPGDVYQLSCCLYCTAGNVPDFLKLEVCFCWGWQFILFSESLEGSLMSHHYWHGTLKRAKICIEVTFFFLIELMRRMHVVTSWLWLGWLIWLFLGCLATFWVSKGVNLNRVGSVFLSIGRFWAEIGVQTNRRLRLFSCLQGEIRN